MTWLMKTSCNSTYSSLMSTPELPDACADYHKCTLTASSITQTVVDSEAERPLPESIPKTIPSQHEFRTLVLCFDGTGDQFDADNSNIVQLCSLLKKDDRSKQMVYYQAGVGTYSPSQSPNLLTSKIYKTVDLMIAWSIDTHVRDGYRFLMQNYHIGDHICIFGFSRGAYTARSLAGMIHKVGLLPPDNWQQVPFAYKMYTRADEIGWSQSTAFKKAFSIDVPIEFVGVWDTVDSVGLIPKELPFVTSNTIIRTFRHAVSLDEHRAKFKANLWNRPSARESLLCTPMSCPVNSRMNTTNSILRRPWYAHGMEPGIEWRPEDEKLLEEMEKLYSSSSARPTDVEEVWFAGCHCDVGGGSVKNSTRYSLSRISLRWMIRECFKVKTGIMFDSERLRQIGLDPTTLYPFVMPRPPALSVGSALIPAGRTKKSLVKRIISGFHCRTQPVPGGSDKCKTLVQDIDDQCLPIGTEEEEELQDALSVIYDQLKCSKSWWILEIIPMVFRQQKENDEWVSWFGVNLGRPREIPMPYRVKVHRSVRMRMEAFHEHDCRKQYKPKAHFEKPIWIDDDVPLQAEQKN
ncbi:uncharacterized protein BT62DRAFT_956306 [Guyanagaster necrorhizus]|uniref:T6SS Phospholipase effector Tle1-like catalytic domain-containing protein n=1 Tax=Guyanagaster necrorhizus TaxID=856835 RepID=A0A9P7VJC3_9AGAR|nr:uncharacterized protein BT62DRAFT_956306 [Guyanagaster necrorhizus MCA 3950]KAG7441014.1 hypothetical protein BT62DRAFT_956306 [Guyanagaster necrorhizus MCA 3950]